MLHHTQYTISLQERQDLFCGRVHKMSLPTNKQIITKNKTKVCCFTILSEYSVEYHNAVNLVKQVGALLLAFGLQLYVHKSRLLKPIYIFCLHVLFIPTIEW